MHIDPPKTVIVNIGLWVEQSLEINFKNVYEH
jgi:hypothetical protein